VTHVHSGNEAMSDEVPGVLKTREQSVDVTTAAVHAVNLGLDSYLDTRLAMVLYRAVYASEGQASAAGLTSVLLDTLSRNPHNIEAWQTIVANIETGVITDDATIKRAHAMLRPWVAEYVAHARESQRTLTFSTTAFECLKGAC